MDALSDDRGQAAAFTVVLLALAVVAVIGLRDATVRIVAASADRGAGEAAVEAAAAVIADAYSDELRSRAGDPSRPPHEMRDAVLSAAPRARSAADDASARNGGPALESLAISCERGVVTVTGVLRDVTFRAGFSGSACSQP